MVSRRDFLKTSGLAWLGLTVGLNSEAAISNVSDNTPQGAVETSYELTAFIMIDATGAVTIVNPRPDMGQGTMQSVPSLIAEELEVDLGKIKIIQSDGTAKFGTQTSGGSSSIRELWLPLRKVGAAAKEMLIRAAANRWNVPVSQCYAADATVFLRNSSKSLPYGELVAEASILQVPAEPKLKNAADFKILGKNLRKLDIPARVTGKAVYGIDIEVPGMVYAAILHSPMLFGKVVSIDDKDTMKIAGVQRVLKCERKMIHTMAEGVAVITSNWWAAFKGRAALRVEWDNGNLASKLDTDRYFSQCYEAAKSEGVIFEDKNDFNYKYATSSSKLEAIYETPFLAHVPVEPENATVHVKDNGTVEVWAPVQGAAETLNEVAEYLNVAREKVKVNVTLLGGSFGRKAYIDFVKEACFISREIKKPVKLIWTREDDIMQGPYRPGMLSHMQGFVAEGEISGYHHHSIGESIERQVFKKLPDDQPDPWLGWVLTSKSTKYQFAGAEKLSWSIIKTEIPIMWWRSVNASNLAWGHECFIDELAHKAGKDPLAARLEMLSDERFKNVLKTLAIKSKYDQRLPSGSGRGIAIFNAFESICACCITVSKSGKGVKIDEVVLVMDCGQYVSADMVKAQTEGNAVMAIGAAIKGGITWKDGVCQQRNFREYEVLRINEMPRIEVHVVESSEAPGGVGESGLPPVAPALGNAIFAAIGKRLRKLPIDIKNLE